jgi:hypothetical protein
MAWWQNDYIDIDNGDDENGDSAAGEPFMQELWEIAANITDTLTSEMTNERMATWSNYMLTLAGVANQLESSYNVYRIVISRRTL